MVQIKLDELTDIDKQSMGKRVKVMVYSMYASGFLAYALYNWFKSAGGMILPGFIEELAWSPGQAALFAAIFTYSYAIANLPLGMLLDIVGPKKVMGTCYVLVTIGSLIFAFSTHYGLIVLGRALTAVGGAAIFNGTCKCISAWEHKKDVPGVIGYLHSFGKFGAVMAATPLALMLVGIGRKNTMLIMACVALLIAISLYVFIKDKPSDHNVLTLAELKGKGAPDKITEGNLMKGIIRVMYQPQAWLLIIATLGINSTINTVIQNWGPTIMKQGLGIPVVSASYVITVSSIAMIVGSACLMVSTKWFGLINAWAISYILMGSGVLCLALFLPKMNLASLLVVYAIIGLGSTYGIAATQGTARHLTTPKFYATFLGLSNLICFFFGAGVATNLWAVFIDENYSIGGFQNACWFQLALLAIAFIAFIFVKIRPIKALEKLAMEEG